MYINGRQAERDLFGMLIKEKQAKRAQEERNEEMQKLYEKRMLRKKRQYERMMEREEERVRQKEEIGYCSNSSSSSDTGNSFSIDQQMIDEYGNAMNTERLAEEFGRDLASSDRPSS